MLDLAVAIARETGEILKKSFQEAKSLKVDRKGRIDLVTEADLKAEKFIRARIRSAFPSHDILGEELATETRGESDLVWCVDPLDGTTNFVHGHPMFAVSLGVLKEGRPILGVVYAPILDEMFAAEDARGAFLNDRPIRVTSTDRLEESLVATGFPYRRAELPNNNVDNFSRLILQVQGIRRCGSAALDLCYVAAGRLDGFWELHLSPWDMAAGACLVREAGGLVTDVAGGDDWLFGGDVVAANPSLHETLRGNLTA